MSLKKYEAFSKTVELGSLTNAADALGYTQSGISHMLNSLEDELGFTLLYRSRSGIRLTTAGEQLLPKIREILDKERELGGLVSRIAGNSAGVVRVGAFNSVAVHWLPEIIRKYHAENPSVEIRLINGNSHEVEDWLIREEVDVAFLSAPAPAGVQAIPLTEESLVAVLPPEHPLTRYDRVPVTLAAKEPIISLLDRSAQDMNRIWSSAEIVPNVHYSVKDDYAIFAMVCAGLGISIMPKMILKGVTNQLVIRELSPPATRTISLGYRDRSAAAVDSFCRCVEDWAADNL